MNAALRILAAGPGATVQDAGRRGYQRYGVTVAGPMDPVAHALANLALGRPRGAAAIEVSLGGLELAAEGRALDLAIVGGSFVVMRDGRRLPEAATFRLAPGERLSIRAGAAGSWCYLTVAGRIDLPPRLGALATHLRSHLGGVEGRALRAGDRIPVADALTLAEPEARIVSPLLDAADAPIRVLLGPQDDYFAPDQIEALLARRWRLGPASDRMAYALEGEPLRHLKGHDIVSDGIAHGAVQVPGSGLPYVLMADRQSTGGYPKIANVIGADLGRVAQLRPGASLGFRAVTREEAVAARRALEQALAGPVAREPLVRTELTSEHLLGLNLVSGVVGDDGP